MVRANECQRRERSAGQYTNRLNLPAAAALPGRLLRWLGLIHP
jgi:hypothetical protein